MKALAAFLLLLAVPALAEEVDRTLFQAHCGFCHLAGGTGTRMLGRRLGQDHALLAERTDLTAEYVKQVVRHGLNSMPPLTRVEVPDPDLDGIAAFLAQPKPAPSP